MTCLLGLRAGNCRRIVLHDGPACPCDPSVAAHVTVALAAAKLERHGHQVWAPATGPPPRVLDSGDWGC